MLSHAANRSIMINTTVDIGPVLQRYHSVILLKQSGLSGMVDSMTARPLAEHLLSDEHPNVLSFSPAVLK